MGTADILAHKIIEIDFCSHGRKISPTQTCCDMCITLLRDLTVLVHLIARAKASYFESRVATHIFTLRDKKILQVRPN